MDNITPKVLQRFWDKVEKTKSCWNWTAAHTIAGYGQFGFNKKMFLAHRFSYEIIKGEIPNGLTIDHLCNNVKCVNPEHLEAVDINTNLKRSKNQITTKNSNKEHCIHGHSLINNFYRTTNDGRRCKTCVKKYKTSWYNQNKNEVMQKQREYRKQIKVIKYNQSQDIGLEAVNFPGVASKIGEQI